MKKLLPQIVAISIQAGHAISKVYAESALAVMTKADDSPLTQADLASDRVIKAGIAGLNLGWPLLSEESEQLTYEDRKEWQRYWLIDPLDGTKEFIKRNGEFTVNIALIENNQPILGVVYAPILNVCYYAATGVGAFVKRASGKIQSIRVPPTPEGQPLKVVVSRSHIDERTSALFNKLGQYECISMGSSLKLCLVAEGAAHFYPRLGSTMEWDTAAAHAVVMMAGGVVHDQAGKELRYNKSDLHNPEFFVRASTDSKLSKIIKVLNP